MHLKGWKLWSARIVVVAAIVGAIIAIEATIAPERGTGSSPPQSSAARASTGNTDPGTGSATSAGRTRVAPEIRQIAAWINSEPLTLEDLRGKVVLVDFWAYSCINCIRTLPHLREWHSKYSPRGLVMIGLHAPEFEFERIEENVRDAVLKQGITWPVGMDNGFATWNAYGNRYWPRKYLIDREGVIRYDRVGEGGYAETEQQIRNLLVEAGANVDDIPIGGADDRSGGGTPITRELYAGYGWASGGFLGNAGDAPLDRPAQFVEKSERQTGRIYLHGTWQFGRENVSHPVSATGFEDYVGVRFTAASVNAVVRPEGSHPPFKVVVTSRNKPVSPELRGDDLSMDEEGRTFFMVDGPRLYNVVRAASVMTADLELRVDSPGFALYTFTFGSEGKR